MASVTLENWLQEQVFKVDSYIIFVTQSCLRPLKIHVQMRFTCCLNLGFNLIILKMSPVCLTLHGKARLSDITWESVAAQTDHYVNVFVCENVACFKTMF